MRLTVSNGADTDFTERTITVTETAVTATASPSGVQSLTFTGAPPTSTVSLSSAGTTGSPAVLFVGLCAPERDELRDHQ